MNCPTCKQELKEIGLLQNPNDSSRVYLGYTCSNCKKSFRLNPPITRELEAAKELYEQFNMKPMKGFRKEEFSLPSKTNPLVDLGKIAGIIYISDKEGTPQQRYIHETNPPYPDFYCTSDGKTFLMKGGEMIIKDGWLYY